MVKLLITFKRRQGMSMQAFKNYRLNVHAPLLLSIPEAKHIRRFVVSYPIADADFDALVEAWFDDVDALSALFDSDNFRDIVDPDHVNFIDMATVRRVITEEIVVVE